jgi:DNA-directed RNA polymerase subunit RPC12/RpoP
MALFRNHYVCAACDGHWIAESAEVLEVDCPHCRVYDVVPYRSDDLTLMVAAVMGTQDDAVTALKATAVKMRGRPIRSKGRGAARVAVH